MHDRNRLRNDPEAIKLGSRNKGVDSDAAIDEWARLDQSWRGALQEAEVKQAEANKLAKEIGALMGQGKKDEAQEAMARSKELKAELPALEDRAKEYEEQMRFIEQRIPNCPDADVPVGMSEEENKVVRDWGDRPDHESEAHWDIALRLGMLDFERASKISGSGLALYIGWGARLQRALFNFMIDHHTLNGGYQEVYPPVIVNSASLFGTGNLPKFEEDLFKVDEDRYLIPTAEVPVTNIYRDEILSLDQLPIKMAAFSGCFRKEAGAAGKDTRGIQRMNQFDKVELVKLTAPEQSDAEHEALTSDACGILQMLGLHHRVTMLCTGEMSFSNAKCYDLEIWSPGMQKYLEVSSCSNFRDFQSRRANLKFRRAQGEKPEFVHTLNGSGLACPRLFVTLLETYYEKGRGMAIPEPLRPYVGTDLIAETS